MYAFLHLVSTVITIYIWLLIAQAILSWLLAFGIVNRYNRVVAIGQTIFFGELRNRRCDQSDPSFRILAGLTFRR